MRYTTIIDLSEYPSLYRNQTVRLVYLHLCLRSGYHDNDRDLITISIRRLAMDVGITIAAARHALHQLETFGLIRRDGTIWKVTKFVVEAEITPRAKSRKQQAAQAAREIEDKERAQAEAQRARQEQETAKLWQQGKTSFMVYYEEQMKQAQQGDATAIAYCAQHKSTYNDHAAAVAASKKK